MSGTGSSFADFLLGDLNTGQSIGMPRTSGAIAPTSELYTLADILATCDSAEKRAS